MMLVSSSFQAVSSCGKQQKYLWLCIGSSYNNGKCTIVQQLHILLSLPDDLKIIECPRMVVLNDHRCQWHFLV